MNCTKRSLFTFFISFLLLLSSCSKQKAPEIATDEIKGSREIERLEACSKVNFNKGVLLYQNMLQLFVCSRWDEQYPSMFKSMKKISAASWDHLMAPIDQSFIENQQRRDKVFKNIRELDSKGGLEDLSYVMVALTETNFFDSAKALFACTENPLDPFCLTRIGRIPEKKSLKNIIKIVDTSPESIDYLSQSLKLFIKAIDENKEDLRLEINKMRASSLYISSRLRLIDSMADKIREGLSAEDREFPGKVLLVGSEEVPWIYKWVQDLKMSREKFRDLLEYPVLTNPDFVGEIKNLEKAYDGGISCSIKDPSSPNNLIDFDFKTELSKYVDVIKLKSYKAFYDFSSEDVFGLKLSTEVCKELEHNSYNANFIKIISHFAGFLSEKKYYDLVKFLVSNSTARGDADKTFAENLYLFDVVTGDFFTAANDLNSNIISSTRNFYPLVFDVVKKLPPDVYTNLGQIAQALGRPENDSRIKALAEAWNFFKADEKNFVFNFVDRHFDKNVNYVLLLDFYTKFLDEYRDVQPLFKDKWIGTPEVEEMSYLTMQDFVTSFAGESTREDFKKFFSRNQILKVLEVISNGQTINKQAIQELQYINSDNYIIRSKYERYKFKINYTASQDIDYDAKAVVDCMQKFSDIQNGFYELVRTLPAACNTVTEANIAFRIYGWLNAVEDSYLKFKQSPSNDSLLDKLGLLSPNMINSSLGMAKVIDTIIGPLGSPVPGKDGVNYLLTSVNDHLNKNSAAPLVNENLVWASTVFDLNSEKNILHRNALVKSLTMNFSYLKTAFNNIGQLFIDYGKWIKSGDLQKSQMRNLGEYDPKQDCQKVSNQVVSPNPCPTSEAVKKYIGDMLIMLQKDNESGKGTAIALILKAIKVGEGLDIPLGSKDAKKVRIGLRDVFQYMYDASDKAYNINKIDVKFTNDSGKTSIEKLTTLERLEVVIREVRFENNYLGANFLNGIVFGDNYNADVDKATKLLETCMKIPVVRCGRRMSSSDLRMAHNAIEVSGSLLDVNNGRGLDSRLHYGSFLKTFESALIGSSGKDAQKVQLFPLKDKALSKHNGIILVDMTMVNTWTNVARVIRDRVGRTRSEFLNFIDSPDFNRVDQALLYGFEFPAASISAENLISKLTPNPEHKNQTLFSDTVDWFASLNYNETRLVEDTLARLMLVGSYLGPRERVFGKVEEVQFKKYSTNNLFQVFLAAEKIIDYWPNLKNYFPGNVRLIDVIKPINTGLYFLTTKLNSESDPKKNTAYLALNDVFLALQTMLFDKMSDPSNRSNSENTTQGLDFMLEVLKDPKLVTNTYTVSRDDYNYLDLLHRNNGEWFATIGQNIKRLAQSPQVDFSPIEEYLSFSSRNTVYKSGEIVSPDNYHYDEPASLVKFLAKKSTSGASNFMLLNQRVFVENFDQILQMLDDLLPCIKIKEVKPPLILN